MAIRCTQVLALAGLSLAMSSSFAQSLQHDAIAGRGIPAGGPYVPAGTLFDNEQSNGLTSLASQNSSSTFTARSADDFTITATGCASNQWTITQIRAQMVQVDAAPQPFAIDIFDDNGAGTSPTPTNAITPISTIAQSTSTNLGAFGAGTSIWEASFVPVGLVLDGNTPYWISGYGATAASNAAGFNNFFASSNGAGASTDNGMIIAPGAGVANWTAASAVIGPPDLAFSFAIDGTCLAIAEPKVPVPFTPSAWVLLLAMIGLLGGVAAWRRSH